MSLTLMADTEMLVDPLQIHQVMAHIPHRYPFLMVDRVTELIPSERIRGFKNVTMNENYFNGHFPGNPIMPGVLQLEALAQLAGILVAKTPAGEKKLGLFTGINNVKFRRQVIPGDQLVLEATVQRIRLPICRFDVKATVNGEITVEGELSFTLIDTPEKQYD